MAAPVNLTPDSTPAPAVIESNVGTSRGRSFRTVSKDSLYLVAKVISHLMIAALVISLGSSIGSFATVMAGFGGAIGLGMVGYRWHCLTKTHNSKTFQQSIRMSIQGQLALCIANLSLTLIKASWLTVGASIGLLAFVAYDIYTKDMEIKGLQVPA